MHKNAILVNMKRYSKVKDADLMFIQKNTGLHSSEILAVLNNFTDLGYTIVKSSEVKLQVKNMQELNALPVGTVIGIERPNSMQTWTKISDSDDLDDWDTASHAKFDPDWLPAVILWKK